MSDSRSSSNMPAFPGSGELQSFLFPICIGTGAVMLMSALAFSWNLHRSRTAYRRLVFESQSSPHSNLSSIQSSGQATSKGHHGLPGVESRYAEMDDKAVELKSRNASGTASSDMADFDRSDVFATDAQSITEYTNREYGDSMQHNLDLSMAAGAQTESKSPHNAAMKQAWKERREMLAFLALGCFGLALAYVAWGIAIATYNSFVQNHQHSNMRTVMQFANVCWFGLQAIGYSAIMAGKLLITVHLAAVALHASKDSSEAQTYIGSMRVKILAVMSVFMIVLCSCQCASAGLLWKAQNLFLQDSDHNSNAFMSAMKSHYATAAAGFFLQSSAEIFSVVLMLAWVIRLKVALQVSGLALMHPGTRRLITSSLLVGILFLFRAGTSMALGAEIVARARDVDNPEAIARLNQSQETSPISTIAAVSFLSGGPVAGYIAYLGLGKSWAQR